MGPQKYIVTVIKDDNKRIFKATEGDRIMMSDKHCIVVGVTPNDELPKNVSIEPLTKDNKYKLKMIKKLTKN